MNATDYAYDQYGNYVPTDYLSANDLDESYRYNDGNRDATYEEARYNDEVMPDYGHAENVSQAGTQHGLTADLADLVNNGHGFIVEHTNVGEYDRYSRPRIFHYADHDAVIFDSVTVRTGTKAVTRFGGPMAHCVTCGATLYWAGFAGDMEDFTQRVIQHGYAHRNFHVHTKRKGCDGHVRRCQCSK